VLPTFFGPGCLSSGFAELSADATGGGGGGGGSSNTGCSGVAVGFGGSTLAVSAPLFIFQKMSPPFSRSISIAARMNGPLPPDFGTGGVVSDIRELHFRHQRVENRRLSSGDYSHPTDRARAFLRGGISSGRGDFDKFEDRDCGVAPTPRIYGDQPRAVFRQRRLACRVLEDKPRGRSEQ